MSQPPECPAWPQDDARHGVMPQHKNRDKRKNITPQHLFGRNFVIIDETVVVFNHTPMRFLYTNLKEKQIK